MRFNGHRIRGFEETVGRKTTTWCVSDHVVATDMVNFENGDAVHVVCIFANYPDNPNTEESVR